MPTPSELQAWNHKKTVWQAVVREAGMTDRLLFSRHGVFPVRQDTTTGQANKKNVRNRRNGQGNGSPFPDILILSSTKDLCFEAGRRPARRNSAASLLPAQFAADDFAGIFDLELLRKVARDGDAQQVQVT